MLFRTLLPNKISVSETFSDRRIELFPEEQRVIDRAIRKRQIDFMTVRACARDALKCFGTSNWPMVPGEWGVPEWPPGLVGSMTHCAGLRCAVVARSDEFETIGIDAEPNEPLREGVLDALCEPQEAAAVRTLLANQPKLCWDRVCFSAKEAVFKAWFQKKRTHIPLENIKVMLGPGQFVADLGDRATLQNVRFKGQWLVACGFVCTVTVNVTASAKTERPKGMILQIPSGEAVSIEG